jgi:hypothetical protein
MWHHSGRSCAATDPRDPFSPAPTELHQGFRNTSQQGSSDVEYAFEVGLVLRMLYQKPDAAGWHKRRQLMARIQGGVEAR